MEGIKVISALEKVRGRWQALLAPKLNGYQMLSRGRPGQGYPRALASRNLPVFTFIVANHQLNFDFPTLPVIQRFPDIGQMFAVSMRLCIARVGRSADMFADGI